MFPRDGSASHTLPMFPGQGNSERDIFPHPPFRETQGDAGGMFPKKWGIFPFCGGLLGIPPQLLPNGFRKSQFKEKHTKYQKLEANVNICFILSLFSVCDLSLFWYILFFKDFRWGPLCQGPQCFPWHFLKFGGYLSHQRCFPFPCTPISETWWNIEECSHEEIGKSSNAFPMLGSKLEIKLICRVSSWSCTSSLMNHWTVWPGSCYSCNHWTSMASLYSCTLMDKTAFWPLLWNHHIWW